MTSAMVAFSASIMSIVKYLFMSNGLFTSPNKSDVLT